MKSFCACLLLLVLFNVMVEAQDCSPKVVGDCINTIKMANNLFNKGSVGDLRYPQQQIDDICKSNAETRRCFFDVLEPCAVKAKEITEETIAMGNEIVNNKGEVKELCDLKLREKYGDISKCYNLHAQNFSLICANTIALEMGLTKIGEVMISGENLGAAFDRVLSDTKETTTTMSPEEALKKECCILNKGIPCKSDHLREKCGEEAAEFFVKIPSSYITGEKRKCVAYKDECSFAINLNAGCSLIFSAIVTIILAK